MDAAQVIKQFYYQAADGTILMNIII